MRLNDLLRRLQPNRACAHIPCGLAKQETVIPPLWYSDTGEDPLGYPTTRSSQPANGPLSRTA